MDHGRALSSHDDDRSNAAANISDVLRLEISLLEPTSEPAERRPSPGPDRAMAFLTVDDDADMCAYVERSMRAIGLPIRQAYQASDGFEALETLSTTAVDLVISDVAMPRMDGLTLCDRLFDDPKLRRIPILLMSGAMPLDEVRRKIRQDAVALIAKPFSARTLKEAIDHLFTQLPPA